MSPSRAGSRRSRKRLLAATRSQALDQLPSLVILVALSLCRARQLKVATTDDDEDAQERLTDERRKLKEQAKDDFQDMRRAEVSRLAEVEHKFASLKKKLIARKAAQAELDMEVEAHKSTLALRLPRARRRPAAHKTRRVAPVADIIACLSLCR